ncbi:MAG TPA: SDR family oxidoreductase [Acidimicrobiales bacterium]|nr:SDR family oxidoreductase [Acidimicrobiales bacterium]
MDRLSVALVTGAGSGIGAALARRLAAEGARVAVVDRDGAKAGEVAAAIPGALAVPADVTDEGEVRGAVERVERDLGPIDTYCSNAGIGGAPGLGADGEWQAMWSVHVLAHLYGARAVLPGMAQRGGGRLVLTASAAGLLSMTQSAPYTVTKHATVALAEWLAIHWGDRGVGVFCLCPQGVRTPMLGDASAEREVSASGDVLSAEEVADAVVAGVNAGRFLILPHPEVARYEQARAADRDRWLAGMRRLAGSFGGSQG